MINATEAVLTTLKEVLAESGITSCDLSQGRPLRDLGLDSLDWAVAMIKFEQRLGVDPFADEGPYIVPTTVGEMIKFYSRRMQRVGKSA